MKITIINIKSEYPLGTQNGIDYMIYPSENN
jgi:hypothetical protein